MYLRSRCQDGLGSHPELKPISTCAARHDAAPSGREEEHPEPLVGRLAPRRPGRGRAGGAAPPLVLRPGHAPRLRRRQPRPRPQAARPARAARRRRLPAEQRAAAAGDRRRPPAGAAAATVQGAFNDDFGNEPASTSPDNLDKFLFCYGSSGATGDDLLMARLYCHTSLANSCEIK